MLKRLSLVCFCLLLSSFAHGQADDFEFGKVAEEDVLMESYPGDLEAEAVVLYDKGETSFQIDTYSGGLNLVYTQTRRIKVLKNSGLDRSNISISYYRRGSPDDQKIHQVKAFSYTLDGGEVQQTALDKLGMFDERYNNQFYTRKFVIPNVKVGSVFEYQYTIEIPKSTNIPDWEFQNDIPTRYSEYQVSMIPFYEYTYLLQGKSRFDRTDSKKGDRTRRYAKIEFEDMIYRFGLKDLPAFTDDSFITSVNDYIIKMDWQLATIHFPNGGKREILSTWPKLSNELIGYENFGKFISGSERAFKKLSPDLAIDGDSPLEQARKITAFVKSNYRWDGRYQKYTEKSVKDFGREKIGSTAEINLFLVGLLRAAGIEANPVLISTRSHGKIKTDYPFDSFFNSTVILVKIDDQLYLTEGTEDLLPFGMLPPECLNEKGLIITKNSNSWVDLNQSPTSLVQENMTLSLDPEQQSLTGQFFTSMTRYDAMFYKKDRSRITSDLNGYELLEELKIVNQDKLNAPFGLRYKASTGLEVLGDNIYLKPFLNKALGVNPLKAATRTYPIDFIYAKKREYNSNINIPAGYKVSTLPQPKLVDDDLFTLDYTVRQEGDQLIAKGSYTLKKSVYKPREYRRLRDHFMLMVDKFNEQIVLEKK